jgi:hypothetical protein
MTISGRATLGSIVALIPFCPVLLGASQYTFVAIPANNSIQTNLISPFPEGMFTAANEFATPFFIALAPTGCGFTGTGVCNFFDAFGTNGSGQSITFNLALPHVTHVFTLMNAYSPAVGAEIATIQFVGSGGATQTFPLVAGRNIRDFYHGSFANTLVNGIPGVHAVNAFHCVDPSECLGGGGTGDVDTGYAGLYVVDEQEFTLSPELVSQALVRIVVTDTHDGSVPILLGLTTLSQ